MGNIDLLMYFDQLFNYSDDLITRVVLVPSRHVAFHSITKWDCYPLYYLLIICWITSSYDKNRSVLSSAKIFNTDVSGVPEVHLFGHWVMVCLLPT